ncbi:MAG: aminotransferase class I/II-fold pyridoxal phosphate-dependent enzyme [Methylobacillus sp.]|jgi:L-2,4-diaminobutyrate decarboxylase|nr:aminotransferase class I/II-fold pyridoxal phosphate-dependent enzyme [Methylobacillus sp.]
MDKSTLDSLFSPENFRATGHALIDVLAEYLANNLCGQGAVLDWKAPAEAAQRWRRALPKQAQLAPDQLLHTIRQDILGASLHIHHPRNLGHQVAPPLPMAALCDLVAALTNQAMAVYETGPSATLLEQQVIRWLGELVGWQNTEGVLTSGGAQANLTALLAARQVKSGGNVWRHGVREGSRILACEHTHYSVSRAAGIMGLGTDAVIKVAADDAGRMDFDALRAAWTCCEQEDNRPFAVVATAGCTPTGSMDPLRKIGEFCRAHELWLHVDGAHGASALLSDTLRPQLDGIALADSVVWDGHKLLYMPATVSAVLFRDPRHSYAAFAQEASYLFQGNNDSEEVWNTSYRTLECTKRMMGLKLWAAFNLYGTRQLGALVEHVFASAKRLADKLAAVPDFELLMPPQTNIVCFRPRAVDPVIVRRKLVESGAFHLTQVRLREQNWLRTTIMNPYTADKDFDALIVTINSLNKP